MRTDKSNKGERAGVNTRVVRLSGNKGYRVIFGRLLPYFEVDWASYTLTELRGVLTVAALPLAVRIFESECRGKDLRIHEGDHHLDLIEYSVGTMDMLIVEDHIL